MPDDPYRTDIVTWSRQQAERLRRHVAGERVNDLDWEHVIEEIEGVANSEIAEVRSALGQTMLHALKVVRWPAHSDVGPWTNKAIVALDQAQERYRPSMAQAISVEKSFARARRAALATPGDTPGQPLPETTSLTLAELMDESTDLRALVEAIGHGAA